MIRVDEVHVELSSRDERVLAYCTIVVGGFAVKDIKLVEVDGNRFVAMPSRKVQFHCYRCDGKNPVMARFCNGCGIPFDERDKPTEGQWYADVCHPISQEARAVLEKAVGEAYEAEVKKHSGVRK